MLTAYKTDPLAMPPSIASRSLWGAQALLGFMGALLLMFALALQVRTTQWLQAVEQQIMFEIPSPTPSDTTAFIDPSQLRDFLKAQNGLDKVRLLSRDQVESSLKGWIDNANILPLPTLLQATATNDFSAKDLRAALDKEYKPVIFHEGKNAMRGGLQQIIALRWLSYTLVFVVIVVGGAMSLASAYWRLDVMDEIVDLLHSMGASRSYITKHLARSCFVHTITSAGCGMLGALFIAGMGWVMGAGNQPSQIQLLSPMGITMAILVPITLAALSAIMAGFAVHTRYTPFRKITQ